MWVALDENEMECRDIESLIFAKKEMSQSGEGKFALIFSQKEMDKTLQLLFFSYYEELSPSCRTQKRDIWMSFER